MVIWRRLAMVSALLVLSPPALAHRPYFIESRPCTLADGSFGEMRILYGDGIFAADPARVVLLDSGGHLLAFSGNGSAYAIDATTGGGCRAYDLARRITLVPEPSAFRPGPDLIGEGHINARSAVLDSTRCHGFTARRSTLLEHARATILYASVDPLRWAIFAGAGVLGMLVFWIGVQPSSRPGWLGLLMRALRLGFVLTASVVLAATAIGSFVVFGGTIGLLLGSGALGAATLAFLIHCIRLCTRRT